ncbi:hypothetical protein Rs2_23136 [Raphanus sativus]|nr:hypothetical protein Rs2_23136 [Raphanus sativus]
MLATHALVTPILPKLTPFVFSLSTSFSSEIISWEGGEGIAVSIVIYRVVQDLKVQGLGKLRGTGLSTPFDVFLYASAEDLADYLVVCLCVVVYYSLCRVLLCTYLAQSEGGGVWRKKHPHSQRVFKLLEYDVQDSPPLYDVSSLKTKKAPVAAVVYYEDMFVNFKLVMETASQISGIRLFYSGLS